MLNAHRQRWGAMGCAWEGASVAVNLLIDLLVLLGSEQLAAPAFFSACDVVVHRTWVRYVMATSAICRVACRVLGCILGCYEA